MRHKTILLASLLALFTAIFYSLAQAQFPSQPHTWQAKVDPWVLETANPALAVDGNLPETEFLVYLAEQADAGAAHALPTKEQKGAYVYETLTAVARRTQPAVVAQLQELGVPYRQFWVLNMIWVRGDIHVVQQMAQRQDVARLLANPTVPLEPLPTTPEQMQRALQAVEWNIELVEAPDVWAAGVTGAGAVIGGQDTGYDWDHVALINAYRGWDGVSADHDYNWHDAIHSGGGICGPNSPQPCDDHGHGTHTMGTMVGNDLNPSHPSWPAGATNAVGMAPGAKWIGCRNMNVGDGTPATYSECYEWFIAPYPLGGDPIEDGDPSKAPHVINNSWGCPVSEGCTVGNELLQVVQNVIAAGIVTVHSAGNSGSGCGTVNTPAGFYDESFSVGATTNTDLIAGFSSRGPSTFDNARKPDISAPGQSIRSTLRNDAYGSLSGTSMAAPHVAGLVGLLVSAQPQLAGQVAAIEALIAQTAVPKTTSQGCGGDGPTDVPNHVYGYGRIDAYNAFIQVVPHTLDLHKSAPALVMAGDAITYTLTLQHQHPLSLTHNVVLTDVIPANTTFITATLPHTFDGDTVQWQAATLDPGQTWQVTLIVGTETGTTGIIENALYGARSDEAAAVLGEPVQTEIAPHALAITKTASAAEIMPGDWLTYTITVQNLDAQAATHNVVLTDVIPAHSTFVSATLPHTFDGTAVRWETPLLAAGAAWQVQLVVATPLTTTAPYVANEAYSVLSDEVTAVAGDPVQTPITPLAHSLALSKSASSNQVIPGDWLTYTLTVTHTHPALPTTNVVLTDVLPTGSALITATLPFTLDGSTVYWHAPLLAPGAVWQVQLVVGVAADPTVYTLINAAYGVRSDEVTAVVTGPPVITFVGTPYRIYLPVISNR